MYQAKLAGKNRYRIFDAAFDDGRDPVMGHETVQQAVVGLLTDFVRAGRVNRLVLLNGPNGSAKSSFVACILRGLEHYSGLPEGALYGLRAHGPYEPQLGHLFNPAKLLIDPYARRLTGHP